MHDVRASLDELFAKRGHRIVPGLERMRESLVRLGWNSHPPTVLIAGTNGKGSVAGCLFRLCSLAGMRVGLYSSPHLVHYCERVQLSHRSVSDDELVARYHSFEQRLEGAQFSELSFFEATTLVALDVFRREDLDLQILEVGLGGRLDATNAVDPDLVCVTSVDWDHMEWLGDSLNKIAYEKLSIARRHAPLFWLEDEESTNRKGLSTELEAAAQVSRSLHRLGLDFGVSGERFWIELSGSQAVESVLPEVVRRQGAVFERNFLGALAMFWCLLARLDSLSIPIAERRQRFFSSLEKFGPGDGRLQVPATLVGRGQELFVNHGVGVSPTRVLVDIAHNPASVETMLRRLAADHQEPAAFVCGFLGDKDYRSILEAIEAVGKPMFLFQLSGERALSLSSLPDQMRQVAFADFHSLWHSLHSAIRSQPADSPVVLCGSFVAVGDVFEYFRVDIRQTSVSARLFGSCPLCAT